MSKFLSQRNAFEKSKKVKIVDDYIPVVNYEQLELNEIDLKKLIDCEKNVIFHQQKSIEHLFSLSETLSEAQKVLANYKNGSFRSWFEGLGLKKDFVYMCIKRYDLYLNYDNKKVMSIPEKIVKSLSRDSIKKELVLEILDSDKPTKKYEEVKNILSGDPTIYSGEIDEVEIIENDVDEIRKLESILSEKYRMIKELQSEIKDIEYRLSILKNKK